MKLALVGVGNAGSRLANRIRHQEEANGHELCNGNILLINSTAPTFTIKAQVPDDRRLVIGDVHREIDPDDVTGDPDLGAEIAREERHEINRALDVIEFEEIDGVLVLAGLAGGTGGGAGAVVLELLQAVCDIPVYAAGVLPHDSEGPERALAAARSLQSFVDVADNVLVFDNNAWIHEDDSSGTREEPAAETFTDANAEFSTRLLTLFAAGELEAKGAPENRVDPSDIMRILDTGGISTIGHAAIESQSATGFKSWIQTVRAYLSWGARDDGDEPTTAAKIDQLVRTAARSKLTLPCATDSADRALILLSGPPADLSRKGFEAGRYWLEREADIVDVMAGDVPRAGSKTLTAVVVFANVTDVPRINHLHEQAHQATSSQTEDGIQFGVAASE